MNTPKVEPPKDEIRLQIADALMTPNQAWKGIKKVPIELLWALEQVVKLQQEALLDRVEKEVIGEDDMDGLMPLEHQPEVLKQRNYLRAEFRAELNKLRLEL